MDCETFVSRRQQINDMVMNKKSLKYIWFFNFPYKIDKRQWQLDAVSSQ